MDEERRKREMMRLLGIALRDARLEANGMTAARAAELAGISKQHLSGVERGRDLPALEALVRLCDTYGILVVDLLADLYPFGTDVAPDRLPPPPPDGRRSSPSP